MKKRKALRLIAPLSFTLLGWPSMAQTQYTETAAKLVSITVRPERPEPTLFARTLLNYCNEMLRVIPSNTPQEAAWIETELRTTDSAKINRAVHSAEYARRFLVEMFTDCKNLTTKLMDGFPPNRLHAIRWTQLALTFHITEDAKIHAARLGLFQGDKNDIYAFDMLRTVRRAANLSAMTVLEKLP